MRSPGESRATRAATWSLLSPLVEAGRRDLFRAAGFTEIPGAGYMKLFHGLPYFNPEYFRAFLRQIPGCPESIFDVLIFGEGDGIDFRNSADSFDISVPMADQSLTSIATAQAAALSLLSEQIARKLGR